MIFGWLATFFFFFGGKTDWNFSYFKFEFDDDNDVT